MGEKLKSRKKRLLIILTAVLLVLTACTNIADSTAELEIKQQYTYSQQQTVETIQVDNCSGSIDIERKTTNPQSIQVAIKGNIGIDNTLLKELISDKYRKENTEPEILSLNAPRGTRMEFQLTWISYGWSGIVVDRKTSQQVEYSAQMPVKVELTSSSDLGCSQAQLNRTPETATRLTATPTIPLSLTRTITPTVTATPSTYAKFNKVWFDANVEKNGEMGFLVHADLITANLRGKQLRIVAYFYKSTGDKLVDTNNLYNTTDGGVAVVEDFTPVYDRTNYADFTLFIPNAEFHLPSSPRTTCKFILKVFDKSTNKLYGESNFTIFTYGR